jgi:hypothetical protein
LRQFFYDWYKRELEALQVPFVEITGQQASRLEQAQLHIDALILQHKP